MWDWVVMSGRLEVELHYIDLGISEFQRLLPDFEGCTEVLLWRLDLAVGIGQQMAHRHELNGSVSQEFQALVAGWVRAGAVRESLHVEGRRYGVH